MQRFIIRIASLAMSLGLTACAIGPQLPAYVPPVQPSGAAPLATITGSFEDPGFIVSNIILCIAQIDGHVVTNTKKCDNVIPLSPDTHTFVFAAEQGDSNGSLVAAFNIIPGHVYKAHLTGKEKLFDDKPSEIWVTDETTNTMALGKTPIPMIAPQTIVVPIFM